jgi:hypothetical protein
MTAHELLSQLRTKGVELKTSGEDRLVIDAPKGTINEELRTALSTHKSEILHILKSEKTSTASTAAVNQAAANQQLPVSKTSAAAPVVQSVPRPAASEDSAIAASTAEEISQLEAEMMRLRTEEEARRAEFETERLAAENALRVEQERWHKDEEEIARRRAERERQRIDAEARERAEEEKRRQIADQDIARAEQELAQMRAAEQTRRQHAEAQVIAAREAHANDLGALRQAEEEQARRRAEEERHYLEMQARKRAQEDELRRRAEMRFRAVEEEIERVQARENARVKAALEAQRLAEEAERRRAEEDARKRAEEQARIRAEAEAKLRAEIEAQLRAEAAERRRAEEESRRQAEEEARRRAEEEARLLAAEKARRLAEEEAQRRADGAARREAEEAARVRAQEAARLHAEQQALLAKEREEEARAAAEVRERAEMEARIRAEIEAKIRAEEAEQRQADEEARRRAEHERIVAEEDARAAARGLSFDIERSEAVEPSSSVEWFEVGLEDRNESRPVEPLIGDSFHATSPAVSDEFREISAPDEPVPAVLHLPASIAEKLSSSRPADRASAVAELPGLGGEEAFRQISQAFDDESAQVRSAAARALFELQEDRAATFTRALRDALPARRRNIGAAIAASGLAGEAIGNLTGESRDKTYDAFSLLFLMAKAGEVQPLMRAIEEHPNLEARLAVVKLLALSGQPEVVPSFRRMAVRGSLPAEIRSAVMEAIYQISSQTPAETSSVQ